MTRAKRLRPNPSAGADAKGSQAGAGTASTAVTAAPASDDTSTAAVSTCSEGDWSLSTRAHPYGVKPQGNRFVDMISRGVRDCRPGGLGAMAILSDELLLQLLSLLQFRELCRCVRAKIMLCRQQFTC